MLLSLGGVDPGTDMMVHGLEFEFTLYTDSYSNMNSWLAHEIASFPVSQQIHSKYETEKQ